MFFLLHFNFLGSFLLLRLFHLFFKLIHSQPTWSSSGYKATISLHTLTRLFYRSWGKWVGIPLYGTHHFWVYYRSELPCCRLPLPCIFVKCTLFSLKIACFSVVFYIPILQTRSVLKSHLPLLTLTHAGCCFSFLHCRDSAMRSWIEGLIAIYSLPLAEWESDD